MDYKYIEQLVERYFQAETTLQEEQILRTFFAQNDEAVPESLRRWRPLFAGLTADEQLSDECTARIVARTEGAPHVKARTVSLGERLRPLFRAAAIVAIVLALGQAMHLTTSQKQEPGDDINYAGYKDTYDDPSMAYDQVEDALMLMSEGFSHAQQADTLRTVLSLPTDSATIN